MFHKPQCYTCPICGYKGVFSCTVQKTGKRLNAICPDCGSSERHRLQYLVFKKAMSGKNGLKMSMVHFAPEIFFKDIFTKMVECYITADLVQKDVDEREDLTHLSFNDNSFDVVYASHVLEHIRDDSAALSEIKRILRPGGFAILPVPIIGDTTIEYDEPNIHEHNHVRCPGQDYYKRYRKYFKVIKIYKSSDFLEKYQPYIYEDRTKWPSTMPLRPRMRGRKHEDMVPVCYK